MDVMNDNHWVCMTVEEIGQNGERVSYCAEPATCNQGFGGQLYPLCAKHLKEIYGLSIEPTPNPNYRQGVFTERRLDANQQIGEYIQCTEAAAANLPLRVDCHGNPNMSKKEQYQSLFALCSDTQGYERNCVVRSVDVHLTGGTFSKMVVTTIRVIGNTLGAKRELVLEHPSS